MADGDGYNGYSAGGYNNPGRFNGNGSGNGHGQRRAGESLADILNNGHHPPTAPSYPAGPPPQRPAPAAPRGDAAQVPPSDQLLGRVVPWETIENLQEKVNARLTQADPNSEWSSDDRKARAAKEAREVVATYAALHAHKYQPLSEADQQLLRRTILDGMFNAGPLQRYLDDPAVTDILIDGGDRPIKVLYNDRPKLLISPLPGGDNGVISWVNRMAGLAEGAQTLGTATPRISFRLPDDSRVQSQKPPVSRRPTVAIRKHSGRHFTLDDLVARGTLSQQLAEFLRACIKTKRNIMISGLQGTGKTTVLRALGQEIPSDEIITTLESVRELFLDDSPSSGPETVFAFEEQRSNGEVDKEGNRIGEITIANLMMDAFRMNSQRVIVGEVRRDEIVSMLEAMEGLGEGSLCTVHCREASGVMGRLIHLCLMAGLSDLAASSLIAQSVDVVVYLKQIDNTEHGGRNHRFVSHVYEIHNDIGDGGRPSATELFEPRPGEPRAVFRQVPSFLDMLQFDADLDDKWTEYGADAWQTPNPLADRRQRIRRAVR